MNNVPELTCFLPGPEQTRRLGADIAAAIDDGLQVHLQGELGAGKTSLVRALIGALGYTGKVRSPTYTLIEPYQVNERELWHLDLYRLADPEELEFLGIRDLERPDAIVLVEWPQNGEGMLPLPDLLIELIYKGKGREARLRAMSPRGARIIKQLESII
jgi:tRNA threonylcarbamoyladenosine biosynthesis protein TsaE